MTEDSNWDNLVVDSLENSLKDNFLDLNLLVQQDFVLLAIKTAYTAAALRELLEEALDVRKAIRKVEDLPQEMKVYIEMYSLDLLKRTNLQRFFNAVHENNEQIRIELSEELQMRNLTYAQDLDDTRISFIRIRQTVVKHWINDPVLEDLYGIHRIEHIAFRMYDFILQKAIIEGAESRIDSKSLRWIYLAAGSAIYTEESMLRAVFGNDLKDQPLHHVALTKYLSTQSNDERHVALAALGDIIFWNPQSVSRQFLERTILMNRTHISPQTLQDLCIILVAGSNFPLHTSLWCAFLMNEAVSHFKDEEFRYKVQVFSDIAVKLMDEISSDQVALLALLQRDDSGESLMSQALNFSNSFFFSTPRVIRLMDRLWSDYSIMQKRSSEPQKPFIELVCDETVWKPYQYFLSPNTKFFTFVISELVFLVLFTVFAVSEVPSLSFQDEISSLEFSVYLLACSFLVHELILLSSSGFLDFIRSSENLYGLFIGLSILTALVIRMIGNASLLLIFRIILSIDCMIVPLNSMSIFRVSVKMGPLHIILRRSLKDIFYFLVLAVLILVGFSIAFYVVLQEEDIDGLENFGETVRYLFFSFLGSIDDTAIRSIDDSGLQNYATILYALYLATAVILLFNILIAMLASTFDEIREDSTRQFLYDRGLLIYDEYRRISILPPPFTLLIAVFDILEFIFRNICGRCCRRKMKPFTADYSESWICNRCFTENSGTPTDFKDYVFKRDLKAIKYFRELFPEDMVLCCQCHFPQHTVSLRNALREKISFFVVSLIVFIPIKFLQLWYKNCLRTRDTETKLFKDSLVLPVSMELEMQLLEEKNEKEADDFPALIRAGKHELGINIESAESRRNRLMTMTAKRARWVFSETSNSTVDLASILSAIKKLEKKQDESISRFEHTLYGSSSEREHEEEEMVARQMEEIKVLKRRASVGGGQ